MRRALLTAVLVAVAVPAVAQFSSSYTFLKAVRDRDFDKVTEFVSDPGASINTKETNSGEGALHIATRARDITMLAFLLGRGARPDIQNRDGDSPLILAAQVGWIDGAERLIARRANVNLANNRGETPLILAVQQRHLPMVRLLLGQGADPNITDIAGGFSALEYARRDGRSQQILRLLEAPRTQPARPSAMGPSR